MIGPQHYRSPQLVRKTHCCGAPAGTANGKVWCRSCGQQILRPTDVSAMFRNHPMPPPPPVPVKVNPRRKRGPHPGQGTIL